MLCNSVLGFRPQSLRNGVCVCVWGGGGGGGGCERGSLYSIPHRMFCEMKYVHCILLLYTSKG